mgnify:CR=1 FL=1
MAREIDGNYSVPSGKSDVKISPYFRGFKISVNENHNRSAAMIMVMDSARHIVKKTAHILKLPTKLIQ